MRTNKRRLGLVLVAAALAGTAACGGGSDADVAVSPRATPAAVSPSPAAGSDGGTDAPESPTGEETVSTVYAGPSEPLRVTYRISGAAAAATPEEIVLAYDPPRSAMIFRGGHVIDAGGQTVFCAEESGGPQCFELPPELSGADNPFLAGLLGAFWVAQTAGSESFEWTETREVAGREARCASFDPSAFEPAGSATEAEFCVDVEMGVGLHYEVTDPDGGVTTITAVDFGVPSEDDFTPAVEPQPLPSE